MVMASSTADPTASSPPSTATTTTSSSSSKPAHPPHLRALASQTHHNLQHQHDWTSLATHTHSANAPHRLLPRPLLSGLPPQRIYTHPDTQAQQLMLSADRPRRPDDETPELEWILPTHVEERWSLRRFQEVFDALPAGDEGRKRVLLATVGGDSTIVYYILHEGIVKPRQN
ncbi:hypothetical protein GP486_006681 [Trichoglossum hirsutum]|uniref:tRNA-splicing endonuclease subunit Sen15 domain-containing protein n=1 Tax=Trichoglossum hirsutum TaxID=265104 RepID=A0A9P8IJZ1_9PEZI|nr:hypothetical protein GP486_006681 [Trichoglossum hirsutum]